jgi:hypothetical protein
MILSMLLSLGLLGGLQAPSAPVPLDPPAQIEKDPVASYYKFIDEKLAEARKQKGAVDCTFKFTDPDFDDAYSASFQDLMVIVIRHYMDLGLTVAIKAEPSERLVYVRIGLHSDKEI